MNVRKESLIVGGILALVLAISASLVTAAPNFFVTVDTFVDQGDSITADYSDGEIIDIVQQHRSDLSTDYRALLSAYSDQEILEIARGTQEGSNVVSSMDPETKEAADYLSNKIATYFALQSVGGADQGGYIGGPWGGDPCKDLAPSGACTPGHGKCVQGSGKACVFRCTPAGTWSQGSTCPSDFCNIEGDACDPLGPIAIGGGADQDVVEIKR